MAKGIKRLILDFPYECSTKEADQIAQRAEKIVMAGVSEGGFMPTSKYGLNVEGCTFSDDTMLYTFGHNRNNEVEKC